MASWDWFKNNHELLNLIALKFSHLKKIYTYLSISVIGHIAKMVENLVSYYSIHLPRWLLKWLNLITAHGSVSNEPGSVTWPATTYLKAVSWRNHTEKLTILWLQNISFWPKINIPSSYFTILMLSCLENTLKLQFDSYVTAVKLLT